ncbi:MAG: class I SAM-dependent methyltransferase [Thermodesulfobacteriota bacterium]
MQARDEYHYTASIYDFLFSRVLSEVRSQICSVLTQHRAANIIDLCCGTGEQLRMLADGQRLLTGVDLSPAMLTRAHRAGPDTIHYLEADASALPFPDSGHDGVIISFALHEKTAAQHEAIFREGCRLLKPAGIMIVVDYCSPPRAFDSQIMGRLLIPAIERAAGLNHYRNYRDWMKRGAIDGFLSEKSPGRITLVTPHFRECVKISMVSGNMAFSLPAQK